VSENACQIEINFENITSLEQCKTTAAPQDHSNLPQDI
jgi:hypothetical protein